MGLTSGWDWGGHVEGQRRWGVRGGTGYGATKDKSDLSPETKLIEELSTHGSRKLISGPRPGHGWKKNDPWVTGINEYMTVSSRHEIRTVPTLIIGCRSKTTSWCQKLHLSFTLEWNWCPAFIPYSC